MTDHIDTITVDELHSCFVSLPREEEQASPLRWGGILNRLSVNSRLPEVLSRSSAVRFQRLFYGTPYNQLSDYSPFVFDVPASEWNFLEYMGALPTAWGFLWVGQAPVNLVKQHWQSLLTVVLPTEKLTHFRFYSPTVFSRMAGACTKTELAWLMGPLAHVFAPLPRESESASPAGWLRISNPRLETESPEAIARAYRALDKPWWQVTEEHTRAFAEVLDTVYRDNLEQRLWESYPELAGEVDLQYGSARQFVDAALQDAHACGFHTRQQEYRFLLLGLHYDFHSASCPRAQTALKLARRDPEAALLQLEEVLRNPPHE